MHDESLAKKKMPLSAENFKMFATNFFRILNENKQVFHALDLK